MNFVKEAYSRVIYSDGRPTRIKSMNSLVKLSPAKEIYARSRRQGGEDKLCWSLSSVLSVTNCLVHSIFWQIINSGLPPVHKPTLHRHSQSCPNPCGSQTPNQASFNKNFKCRFFYESLFVVEQETIFIGRVCWLSSFVVCYKEQHQNSSLFFPYNSLVPAQTESTRHCLEKSLPLQLCGQN